MRTSQSYLCILGYTAHAYAGHCCTHFRHGFRKEPQSSVVYNLRRIRARESDHVQALKETVEQIFSQRLAYSMFSLLGLITLAAAAAAAGSRTLEYAESTYDFVSAPQNSKRITNSVWRFMTDLDYDFRSLLVEEVS